MDRKLAVSIVAVVVALTAGWQLVSAQGEKDRAVQKWEYKALTGGTDLLPHDSFMEKLNEAGSDGWELVSVEPATTYYVPNNGPMQGRRVFHLKRPK